MSGVTLLLFPVEIIREDDLGFHLKSGNLAPLDCLESHWMEIVGSNPTAARSNECCNFTFCCAFISILSQIILNWIKLIFLTSRLGFFPSCFSSLRLSKHPTKSSIPKWSQDREKENLLVAEVTELTVVCKNQNWRPWWSICMHLQPGPPVFGSNGIAVYSEECLLLAGHDMPNVLTLK